MLAVLGGCYDHRAAMTPQSEALLVAVVVLSCAIALLVAGNLFWIRRRLDAKENRDRRIAKLRRLARQLGIPLSLEQSVFEEDDLSEEDRRKIAFHLAQHAADTTKTRAGTPAESAELQRAAAPTPRSPLPAAPPEPKEEP